MNEKERKRVNATNDDHINNEWYEEAVDETNTLPKEEYDTQLILSLSLSRWIQLKIVVVNNNYNRNSSNIHVESQAINEI